MEKVREFLASEGKVYVSVTGLSFQKPWYFFHFWWYAVRSKIQSDKAPGNLFSEARRLEGVQHTLTVWTSKKAMLGFVHSGVHKKAVSVFRRYFTGKTYGYETTEVPTWESALEQFRQNARDY
jgi:hypothetical protein